MRARRRRRHCNAIRHGRQAQLTGFLEATVKQSPKDSRFAVLLAQVDTTFEDLPGALHAYDAAIAIRKDRVDLYRARAELELHLAFREGAEANPQQLDRAAADFDRLYTLSYHDPQYQVRVAEVRARQGRAGDAVKALQVAYVAGQATSGAKAAANAFQVADHLESWNLLAEARTFAEQGVRLAGGDLLTGSSASGPQVYARVLTRLGKAHEALAMLAAARTKALAASPSTAALQAMFATATEADSADAADADEASEAAPSASDAAALRKSLLEQRRTAIEANLERSVQAIGATVQKYDTPEQKAAYGATLDALYGRDASLALAAATSAGLAEREAAWRRQQLLTGTPDSAKLETYTALEQHRLLFAELGQTLEVYAARLKPDGRPEVQRQAAQAYRDAGTAAAATAEVRVERPLAGGAGADPAVRERFLSLLLARDAGAYAALAAGDDPTLAAAAMKYVLAHGSEAEALATVAAHGRMLPAVWRPAASASTRLYFAGLQGMPDQLSTALADFEAALDAEATIADQIGHPADPARQLTGDLWLDYAGSFGILLNLPANARSPLPADKPDAEDFLPASLEFVAAQPAEQHQDLARTYAEAGNVASAKVEYAHVLELDPSGEYALSAHDELGVLLAHAGDAAGARAEWRAGLDLLREMGDKLEYPERYFTAFSSILRHTGAHHLSMRPEIEAILRPYLAHNGNYRSNELLKAAYEASLNPEDGAALLLSLADAGPDPDMLLSDVQSAPWLPAAARHAVLARRIELARTAPASAGDTSSRVQSLQSVLLTAYLDAADFAHAQALLDTIPFPESAAQSAIENGTGLPESRLRLAAHAGRLDALLARYAAVPDAMPGLSVFSATAAVLGRKGDQADARVLMEFVFEQKQQTHTLLATDFLALAQARLETDDVPGALQVLHRLTLQPVVAEAASSYATEASSAAPDPYSNLDAAAALLESTHHPAEALPFLASLASSVPWNAGYRLRLAEAQAADGKGDLASAGLLAIGKDATAPYAVRVEAAQALARTGATGTALGSAELDLLLKAHPSVAEAGRPGFVAAQLAVAADAQTSAQDRIALLHEALASAPLGSNAERARLDLLVAETEENRAPGEHAEAAALLRLLDNASVSLNPACKRRRR